MVKKLSRVFVTLLALGVLLFVETNNARVVKAQSPQVVQVCKISFEATVREGTDKSLSLTGDMTLNIEKDGGFTGSLVEKDGTKIAVYGQITGRNIGLVFELEPFSATSTGKYIFGSGSALKPIMADGDCGGPLGGTFSGPSADDIGTWLSIEVCVTINGSQHCASLKIT